jgi:hypothetical protein
MVSPALTRAARCGALLGLIALAGCGGSTLTGGNDGAAVGLPERTGAPDLSRVTPAFRASGGNAFVVLTGRPTPAALEFLRQRGLAPPPGYPRIRTFDNLGLRSVWGRVPPNGVDVLAGITFVTAIEPSADIINLGGRITR